MMSSRIFLHGGCSQLVVALIMLGAAEAAPDGAEAVIWKIDNAGKIGGQAPAVLGAPPLVVEAGRKALRFNGESDGLIFAQNPLEGHEAFTIEVLFKPEAGGPAAQRFVHLEDSGLNRALIETRVTSDGQWYLDTYLFSNPTKQGLTLVDREQLHPCDRWYWAALVYNGKVMSHFVDGTREREGTIAFGPMAAGRTSVGVRLNQVFWFQGCIAEVRFHPRALAAEQLQRPDAGLRRSD